MGLPKIFSKGILAPFFGGNSKKQDTTYTGPQPIQSITELPMGKTLSDILMQRMQGQGVGYSPDFVDRTTSPVIAQRMARYNEYELPELTSAMSARGLQRSSLTGDLIRRQAGARERDIMDTLAQAYSQNEQEKQRQISEALGMGQSTLGMELGQRSNWQQSQYGDYLNQLAQRQAQQQSKQQGLNNMIATGSNIASYLLPYAFL